MKKVTKKALAFILLVLTLVSAVTFNACASDSNRLLGDSNQDSMVNIKDATAVQKHLADILKLSDTGLKLSDTDQNGTLNIKDATTIQKWLAGIKVNSPVGDPFDVSGSDTPEAKDIVTTVFSYDCAHTPTHSNSQNGNTYHYRIPQINLDHSVTYDVNKEIMDKYSYLQDIDPCTMTDAMSLFSLDYEWAANDDILSFYTHGKSYLYYFYDNILNISISTGKVISHKELLNYTGYTEDEYKFRLKEVVTSGYLEYFVNNWSADFIENNLSMFSFDIQKTISDRGLQNFKTTLNKNGELCVIGYLYYPAGSGKIEVIFNLDTHEVKEEYLDIVNNLPKTDIFDSFY